MKLQDSKEIQLSIKDVCFPFNVIDQGTDQIMTPLCSLSILLDPFPNLFGNSSNSILRTSATCGTCANLASLVYRAIYDLNINQPRPVPSLGIPSSGLTLLTSDTCMLQLQSLVSQM
jgi:hypothetical protein